LDRFQSLKSWIATEVIDLGVPKDAVRSEDLRRIRLISITTIGLVLAAGFPAALQFSRLDMPYMTALIGVTIAGAIGNLFLLRKRRNPKISAHIGVALLASLLLASNVITGGFYNPNFAWLYVVPLAAAAVIDMRGAAFWTGFVMLTSVVFWLLPDLGIVLVDQVPPDAREGNALFNRVTAVLAIGVIGASFVTGQRRAEHQLATANHDLLAETAYVHLLMHGAVAANEAYSFDEAMRDSMHRICETMDWAAGLIYTVNEDGTIVTSGISHTRLGKLGRLEQIAASISFRTGEGIVGLAVSEREPQIRESLPVGDDPQSASAIAERVGIRSAIAVPVSSVATFPR
jgi:hypothetical protein